MTPMPAALFEPGTRHLVILAHQDDELPYAGLLQRMDDPAVIFTTNGDGLHFELDMEPEAYAALRRNESLTALRSLGIPGERIAFFDHSELTFYAAFGAMSQRPTGDALPSEFEALAAQVDQAVQDAQPDVVWTMAWQGGNPEHDLTHLCASRAVRRLRQSGKDAHFFELPAYELMVLVMRFGRWYDGDEHAIALTDDELEAKRALLSMYPTQERVIRDLSRAIRAAGWVQRLRGRTFTFDDFARREVFGLVPSGRDYTRSTHRFPLLDYPGDDWKGQRIRFERTLARVGRVWANELA